MCTSIVRYNAVLLTAACVCAVPGLQAETGVSDGVLVLIRHLGPTVGLMQNLAIRTVLSSFGAALPGILTVMIPISFLILVFSIVGMELFGGSLKRCACVHDNRIVIAEAADGMELCTMMLNYTQNIKLA